MRRPVIQKRNASQESAVSCDSQGIPNFLNSPKTRKNDVPGSPVQQKFLSTLDDDDDAPETQKKTAAAAAATKKKHNITTKMHCTSAVQLNSKHNLATKMY